MGPLLPLESEGNQESEERMKEGSHMRKRGGKRGWRQNTG